MKKHIITFFIAIFASWHCAYSAPLPADTAQPETWLTVFVHGILNIQPHLNASNIMSIICDQIEDTIYTRAVEYMRKDPFFYQFNAMQGLGLQKIDPSIIQPGASASAFAAMFETISAKNRSTPSNNIYYTFGWSGLLSGRIRYLEATHLYELLLQELKKYHANNIFPKIRILAYSHGGNVIINLGNVHKAVNAPEAHIDELYLIGVPIIAEAYEPITSPLFKKIYHFYSYGDRVQPIDCLSGGFGLSGRTFESHGSFKVPEHMVQIDLRIKRIANNKPHKKPKHINKRLIRNASPGHTELWSFGWTYNYRKYLPIYPLPAATFFGYITNAIQQELPTSNRVYVDIQPFNEQIILCDMQQCITKATPFLTYKEMDTLRSALEGYIPHCHHKKHFDQKTEQAIKRATEEKTQEWHYSAKATKCGHSFTKVSKCGHYSNQVTKCRHSSH